jgi:hypothetical protein
MELAGSPHFLTNGCQPHLSGSKAHESLSAIRTVQAMRLEGKVIDQYTVLLRAAELMGYSKARDNGLGIGILGAFVDMKGPLLALP